MLDKMGEMNLQRMKETDPTAAEQMEKLGSLFSSEDFIKQFETCADNETAAKLFADNGFAITVEQIEALMTQIKAIGRKLADNDGELDEADLEMITGGEGAGLTKGAAEGLMYGSGGVLGASIGSAICPGLGTVIGFFFGVWGAAWLAKD
jgi:hypothetical protein